MRIIDLRSDTVTRPTAAMRAAMVSAEVGDDVYGEDPSVKRLEAMIADLADKEAAVFAASGTQSNLMALLTHCQRGDEYLAGQQTHVYQYEGGGAAVLGGIQPQPLDMEADGSLNLERLAQAIKPDDIHFTRTRLLCLENTFGGNVLPLNYLAKAHRFTRERGLALHLDGARVFNAAVKLGAPLGDITRYADSVSICLSKGLGAPVGTVLCGTSAFITQARRWRKVLGGGMRQAGILAAAGIHALENHVARLAEDHANARNLAEGLARVRALGVNPDAVQTNMVIARPDPKLLPTLAEFLARHGVLIRTRDPVLRLVVHLDVSEHDVLTAIQAFREFYARRRS